jgi:hypothetical protein
MFNKYILLHLLKLIKERSHGKIFLKYNTRLFKGKESVRCKIVLCNEPVGQGHECEYLESLRTSNRENCEGGIRLASILRI